MIMLMLSVLKQADKGKSLQMLFLCELESSDYLSIDQIPLEELNKCVGIFVVSLRLQVLIDLLVKAQLH